MCRLPPWVRMIGIGITKARNRLGEFGRSVLTLMSGTLISQIIMIAVSPILTRIYTPSEFGVFAAFVALSSVAAIASTGRFDLAINLPHRELVAAHLALLAVICAALITCLFSLGAIAANHVGYQHSHIAAFVPVSVALIGLGQVLNYWCLRRKEFNIIAFSRAAQAITFVSVSVAAGRHQLTDGLILAYLLGQLVNTVSMACYAAGSFMRHFSTVTSRMLFRTMQRYRAFPRYLILAHTLNALSFRLPTLCLPLSAGAAAAGYYSLTQQVLGLPMQLIGSAIGDVFRQRASEEYRKTGSCERLYRRTFIALLILYIVPFVVLLTAAPFLFSFIFGAAWEQAGRVAQLLAPMFYLQFVTSPLSSMFMIAEKQQQDLLWQFSLISLVSAALLAGGLVASFDTSIVLLCLAYSISYIVCLRLTYGYASSPLLR